MAFFATVVTFSACSGSDDDNPTPPTANLSIYVDDSVKVGTGASVDNKFVAYSSKGYLYGFHVGETTYTVNGSTAKVVVKGKYNALDVVTDWGISPAQLKAKVKAKPETEQTLDNGDYMIAYQKIGRANLLGYIFKNNKLVFVGANSSPTYQEEIVNYLKERYIFSPEQIDDHTFAGVDGLDEAHIKTYVTVGIETDNKYDYMLQTCFMSTELIKPESKQLKAQMSKMMQSMPRMAQPK